MCSFIVYLDVRFRPELLAAHIAAEWFALAVGEQVLLDLNIHFLIIHFISLLIACG